MESSDMNHTNARDISYARFQTRLGPAFIACAAERITGFYFEGQKHFDGPKAEWQLDEDAPALARLRRQYQEYEAGERHQFELPVRFEGTEFQRRVWQALQGIEFGQTMSYGQLAQHIGAASAVRAVGAAVGRNPISVIVPCHRVLGASGALTGYAGGLDRKQFLLKLEGVHV
jgi:methylated-DNA-[protein]-cysteine S-methyltransferase